MADESIEMLAAELALLIYERWLSAAEAGFAIEHAAIEAQVTLIEALQGAAADPQSSALMLLAAVQVLGELQHFAVMGEFQAAQDARVRKLSGIGGKRIDVLG